jgi:hypothetical protein
VKRPHVGLFKGYCLTCLLADCYSLIAPDELAILRSQGALIRKVMTTNFDQNVHDRIRIQCY